MCIAVEFLFFVTKLNLVIFDETTANNEIFYKLPSVENTINLCVCFYIRPFFIPVNLYFTKKKTWKYALKQDFLHKIIFYLSQKHISFCINEDTNHVPIQKS